MTRIAKLLSKLEDGSHLSFAEFQRLLIAFGFVLVRVRGSHHMYVRDDIRDQMNVQPMGKQAKPYQLRQFEAMIARHDLRLDETQ